MNGVKNFLRSACFHRSSLNNRLVVRHNSNDGRHCERPVLRSSCPATANGEAKQSIMSLRGACRLGAKQVYPECNGREAISAACSRASYEIRSRFVVELASADVLRV